jgi:hypothetical protein
MFLFQAAAGAVATPYDMEYVPQILSFTTNGNTPALLTINVAGDGALVNLDTDGLDGFRLLGLPSNQANHWEIILASGLVKNKTTRITLTNVALGAAIDVFGRSKVNNGMTYFQYLTENVIANSGRRISKFSYLSIPNAAAGDICIINYKDGLQETVAVDELLSDNGLYQNNVGAAIVGINNSSRDNAIETVNFQPALAQNIYVLRLKPVGDLGLGL